MHLTPNGCVIGRDRVPLFPLSLHKMLEYCRVCSTFESVFALPLGVICYFLDRFNVNVQRPYFLVL